MRHEFTVHVWLDVKNTILGVSRQPFMRSVRGRAWTKQRLRLFRDFTLKSLLNQSDQEFRIFLFLDPDMKHLHDEFDLHPKVERIYDSGKRMYTRELTSDHVFIFRTDSDDLLHRRCIETMKDRAKYGVARQCQVLHKVSQWNMHHKFISDYRLPRSPFCAHTFPRKIYSAWDRIRAQQFMDYKTCPNTVEEKLVCIIRHGRNVTFPRIGKDMYSQKYYLEEMQKRNNIVKDRAKMIKILSDYGITEDQVK